MSQAVIGNLRVNLGLDTAQFDNGTRKAQSSLAGLAGSIKGLAIGAAAGATAALGGLAVAVQQSLGRMDELGKAAQKIGIPVDEFSKLEYAAKLSDVSLETLTGTLAKFSRSLADIASGGENDAGAALTSLGVSATDAEGRLRPTAAIIQDVADKFATMENGAQKTAFAVALFGKSGAELIPLLNGGREAIQAAGAELERFGGVVTPEAAAAAEDFNDNLTRMQTAASGVATTLAGELAPFMAEVTANFLNWVDSGGAAQAIWEGINWVLQQSLQFMYETIAVWKSFTAYVYGAGEALQALAGADLEGASAALARAGKNSEQAWADAEKQFLRYRALLNGTASEKAGKGSLPADINPDDFSKRQSPGAPSKPGLAKTGTSTNPLNIPAIQQSTIDDVYGYGEAVGSLKDRFSETTEQAGFFSDSLSRIGSTIQSGISDALSGLISGTMSVKEAFASMAQSIIQTLSDLAAEMIASGLMKILFGALGGGNGTGFNIGGMVFGGLYANGGYLGSGKWGIAGEAGPEIVHGPARITPMDKMGGGSPVNVTVINNTPAKVNTRQSADGGLTIEVVEEAVATAISRGGNKIDAAMQRGFGLRRAGR